MKNIKTLLMRRADLIRQIKENKADSASGYCSVQHPVKNSKPSLLLLSTGSNTPRHNCIERAYNLSKEISSFYDQFSFNECFYDLLQEDQEPACDHCKKVIANKRDRGLLGRKLGGVNSALTRLGQRLLREQGND